MVRRNEMIECERCGAESGTGICCRACGRVKTLEASPNSAYHKWYGLSDLRFKSGRLQQKHVRPVFGRDSEYEWRDVPSDDMPMTGHAPSPPPKIEPWDDPELIAPCTAPVWAREKALDFAPPGEHIPPASIFRAKLAEALEKAALGYFN
jgi:hypothetical protein